MCVCVCVCVGVCVCVWVCLEYIKIRSQYCVREHFCRFKVFTINISKRLLNIILTTLNIRNNIPRMTSGDL